MQTARRYSFWPSVRFLPGLGSPAAIVAMIVLIGRRVTRLVIIDGHPDPDRGRFVHALADACARGAAEGGHEVRRIEVASLDFRLLRSQHQWEEGEEPLEIAAAQDAIAWAGHVVFRLLRSSR